MPRNLGRIQICRKCVVWSCAWLYSLCSTPVPALTVFGLASSVILTWLYRASGKSALPALLFHAANDAWPALLPSPADARVFELSAGMYALVAIALVVSGRVPLGATDPGRGGE